MKHPLFLPLCRAFLVERASIVAYSSASNYNLFEGIPLIFSVLVAVVFEFGTGADVSTTCRLHSNKLCRIAASRRYFRRGEILFYGFRVQKQRLLSYIAPQVLLKRREI